MACAGISAMLPGELAAAPRAVALAGVVADPRDRRLRDDRLLEGLLERRLDVADREPAQEGGDDERVGRATPLPTTLLAKSSPEAFLSLGRSSSTGPEVVLTVTGS